METPEKIIEEIHSLAKKPYSQTKKRMKTLHDTIQDHVYALLSKRKELTTPEYKEYAMKKAADAAQSEAFGLPDDDDLPFIESANQIGSTPREHKLVSSIFRKWHSGINQPDYRLNRLAEKYFTDPSSMTNAEFDKLAEFQDDPSSVYQPVEDELEYLKSRLFDAPGVLKYNYNPAELHRYELLQRRLPTFLMSGQIQDADLDDVLDELAGRTGIYTNYKGKINTINNMPIEEATTNLELTDPTDLAFSGIHKQITGLNLKIEQYANAYKKLATLLKDVLNGAASEDGLIDEEFAEYFETNKPTISESINEQVEEAKSIAESLRNVSKANPEIEKAIAEIESKAQNLSEINKKYITFGMTQGMALQLSRDMREIRKAIQEHAPNIMNGLAEYEKQTGVERNLEEQIRSLMTYKDYLSLPPAAFEHLPESIKRKCRQLEELMNKLNNVKKIKAAIPEQYKLNASKTPTSSDKSSPKVLNPMLNRGYRLFDKVGMHQSMFNKNFN